MSIYKIEPLLSSGFNFNEVFPDKQEALKSFGGYNFGLQEIAQLLRKQTDNFKSSIPVALDIDKYLYEAYEKFISGKKPKEEPAPAPAPAMTVEEEIKSIERKIRVYTLGMRNASADEKASIERKIRVYKIRLRGLENKKEKGGAVILTGTQSAGDPKPETGEVVVSVEYSASDPDRYMSGGHPERQIIRAIWHGKEALQQFHNAGEYNERIAKLIKDAQSMLQEELEKAHSAHSAEFLLLQELEFMTNEVKMEHGQLRERDRERMPKLINEAKHYLSDKHYEDGGEINHKESLLNFVQNHLSAGYVGGRLHDLGYHEAFLYTTIDIVRSTMIEILIEHGDEIYSISSLNKLIADAAYNMFGKAPNQETAHYRKTHHFNEGGEMDSPEFAKAHREYEAFVANELPPHIGDNVDTRGWVLEDRSGNTGKTDKELERLKKRAKSYNERFDVMITEDDKNYYLRTREKESYDGEIRVFGHGGGFEKLAHHVAHEYEGTKVPAKYQKVYHEKRYSHESAEEVGRKVAAKVYREQQSHQ